MGSSSGPVDAVRLLEVNCGRKSASFVDAVYDYGVVGCIVVREDFGEAKGDYEVIGSTGAVLLAARWRRLRCLYICSS